jgi:enoyl-CoA hydratase
MSPASRDESGGLPVVHDESAVRWVTFNRPEVLNALRAEDLVAVADAVTTVGPGISAIVFTGAGDRAFCAGVHVDTFVDARPDEGEAVISRVGECVGAVRRAPIPTVAMVNGYCLGAAFELALACDLRVAVPDARFGLPEVKLGIPSVIEAALLPRHVGLSKATEMILTGDLYSVDDLAPFGLVNRVAHRNQLRQEVLGLLDRITPHTGDVVAAQKALIRTWLDTGLQDSIDASVDVFADVFALPSTVEAIARYRQGLGRSDA